IQHRLDPIAWLCLAVLVATGLFQMSANPNYTGFLAVDNRWAAAILIKHLVIGIMVAVSAYQTWVILPGLRRIALLQARGRETPEIDTLRKREAVLLTVNLVLAGIVLALTAAARSVG
ncbi:MAG TPA: CopD family protein, partial [Anaerolineales bacterium]|nr:CopD family protein [Anaerolineales bacterium]